MKHHRRPTKFHGTIIPTGEMRGLRWCDNHHKYHAPLYLCKHFKDPLIRRAIGRGWEGLEKYDESWLRYRAICALTGEDPYWSAMRFEVKKGRTFVHATFRCNWSPCSEFDGSYLRGWRK